MERKTQSAGPMTKKRMEEYYEGFNKQGEKIFSTYYTEDAVFETSWDKKFSGLKNTIKYMEDVAHYGGKIKETLTPLKILIDGDDVAAEFVWEWLLTTACTPRISPFPAKWTILSISLTSNFVIFTFPDSIQNTPVGISPSTKRVSFFLKSRF